MNAITTVIAIIAALLGIYALLAVLAMHSRIDELEQRLADKTDFRGGRS